MRSTLIRFIFCVAAALTLAANTASAIGTPFMVKDIRPGPLGSAPNNLLPLGALVFFFANDGTTGREPWVSEATTLDTHILFDVYPGPSGSYTSAGAAAFPPYVYFGAFGPTSFKHLWRSDGVFDTREIYDNSVIAGFSNAGPMPFFAGTEGGSQYLLHRSPVWYFVGADLLSSVATMTGRDITEMNGRAYFPADDGTHGMELWSSDGTVGGTSMVVDFNPGSSGSAQSLLTPVGNLIYCFSSFGLMRSDGTAAGTFSLAPLQQNFGTSDPHQIADLHGLAIILAKDPVHGTELWKSDGTPAGTAMVKEFYPGTVDGVDGGLAVLGNYAYFAANDVTHGSELWRTDGTAAGTTLVKDIRPGTTSSSPSSITALNGAIFFTASEEYGTWPWMSDGTDAGTVRIADAYPTRDLSQAAQYTYAFGYVYFTADDGIHGNELWAVSMAPAITGVELPNPAIRGGVALAQNAPNPITRSSTIRYTLPASGRARLRLFDVTGRELRTLVDDEQSAGEHVATLDATALTAGLYFYRLEAAGVMVERKTLIVR